MKFTDFIVNVLRALKFPMEEMSQDTLSRVKKVLYQKDTNDVLLRKRLFDLCYATVEFMLENAREVSLFQEISIDEKNDDNNERTLLNSAENEELLNSVNVSMFMNGTISMVFDFLNNTEEIVQNPKMKSSKQENEESSLSSYSRDSVENVVWGLFSCSQSFLGTLETSNLSDFSLIRTWRSKITFKIL